MQQVLQQRNEVKNSRRLKMIVSNLGDHILDEKEVRQYYFDRTKVSLIEKERREMNSLQDRLNLIREVSNQVIEKYFSIVKKKKAASKVDQISLSRMQEVEKQKEVEEFIKHQLETSEEQVPKKRAFSFRVRKVMDRAVKRSERISVSGRGV